MIHSPNLNSVYETRLAASVVFFRIAFGVMMVVEVGYEYFTRNLHFVWATPQLHFSYTGFAWLPELNGAAMLIVFAGVAVAAIGIAIGWFYRFSAAVFVLLFGYIFLLEQAAYQNHLYLFWLLGILLMLIPAHQAVSMDATQGRVETRAVIGPGPSSFFDSRLESCTCLVESPKSMRTGLPENLFEFGWHAERSFP